MAAIALLSDAIIMPPRASSSKTAVIAGILAGLLAAGLGAFYLHQQSAPHGTDAPAAGSPAPEPSARAVDALMALPEIKAWSAHIEKASGGRAHGAVMETSPDVRLIDGKPYHDLSFMENTPEAAHRWESFVVSQDGKRILVDDVVSGELISLEQWRKDNAPMQRIATQ